MGRTRGSNGDRLDQHDKLIGTLQKEVAELVTKTKETETTKATLDSHINTHIKDDLETTKFSGTDKPLYTYDEIAQRYQVPKSRVQKVAEENNLTRRKSTKIG
jgi:hypothetical protein